MSHLLKAETRNLVTFSFAAPAQTYDSDPTKADSFIHSRREVLESGGDAHSPQCWQGGSGGCPALGKSDNKIKFLVQEVRSVGSDGKVSLVPGGRQRGFPISLVLCAAGHQAWNLSLQSGSLPLPVTRQDTLYSSNILRSVRVVGMGPSVYLSPPPLTHTKL